jgi:hypothetical protein
MIWLWVILVPICFFFLCLNMCVRGSYEALPQPRPRPRQKPQTVEEYYKALRDDLPPAERKWLDEQTAAANLFWISSQNKYVQPDPGSCLVAVHDLTT